MAKIHEMTTPADRALAAMQLNGEPRRPEQPERERPLLVGALPDRIRHRFPIFQKRLYINSCSQGALSDSVREAYARYLEDWDARGSSTRIRTRSRSRLRSPPASARSRPAFATRADRRSC